MFEDWLADVFGMNMLARLMAMLALREGSGL